MDNDSYLKTLKNADAWFEQAFAQKMVADKILVDVIMSEEFVISLKEDESKMMDFVSLWGNALYHYGIGIENGLKGVIVKNHPELINLEVSGDDVVLKDIGGKASKNHDLYSLANRAGILDRELNLFKYDSDRKLLKNVLKHLTDVIRWAARYPVPSSPSKVFEMEQDVPFVGVYGFHILDIICPIFDYFQTLRDPNCKTAKDYLDEYLREEFDGDNT